MKHWFLVALSLFLASDVAHAVCCSDIPSQPPITIIPGSVSVNFNPGARSCSVTYNTSNAGCANQSCANPPPSCSIDASCSSANYSIQVDCRSDYHSGTEDPGAAYCLGHNPTTINNYCNPPADACVAACPDPAPCIATCNGDRNSCDNNCYSNTWGCVSSCGGDPSCESGCYSNESSCLTWCSDTETTCSNACNTATTTCVNNCEGGRSACVNRCNNAWIVCPEGIGCRRSDTLNGSVGCGPLTYSACTAACGGGTRVVSNSCCSAITTELCNTQPCPTPIPTPPPGPTPTPSSAPTPQPTASPTPVGPTPQPTASPTVGPTPQPTASPTTSPSPAPTTSPSPIPTPTPCAPIANTLCSTPGNGPFCLGQGRWDCSGTVCVETVPGPPNAGVCSNQCGTNCFGANGVRDCNGVCTAPPAPLNRGSCGNGYTGGNTAQCLQNGYQDCTNSPECRVCAPGVCCDDSYTLVQSPPTLGTAEVCNGRDDNCDVTVDEGGVCTGGVCSGGWGFYDDGNTYKQRWSQILSDDIR